MKTLKRSIVYLLLFGFLMTALSSCKKPGEEANSSEAPAPVESSQDTQDSSEVPPETAPVDFVDYVGGLKLDFDSETKKQEVTVKLYVDGDTTHFYVPEDIVETGVLKARYIGCNTPESTGSIENGANRLRTSRRKN